MQGTNLKDISEPTLREYLNNGKFGEYDQYRSISVFQPILLMANPQVAIIGGGAAGLYAGMILQSLDIPFRIYEVAAAADVANGSAGRIKTHQFPAAEPAGTHDYYDIGAMRFPDTDVMKRLFDLVRRDDLFDSDGQLLRSKLRDYHFGAEHTGNHAVGGGICFFHGVRVRYSHLKAPVQLDPEQVTRLAQGFGIHQAFIRVGHEAFHHDVVDSFVSKLRKDLATNSRDGWAALMDYDNWSTRSYLSNAYLPSNDIRHELRGFGYDISVGRGLPTRVVDWLETMGGTTGFYDAGLATMVMGGVAFGSRTKEEERLNDPPQPKFYCFEGGSRVLTRAMKHHIETQPDGDQVFLLGHRVTAIAQVGQGPPANETPHEVMPGLLPKGLQVTSVVNGVAENATYSHVISTVPITCLRYSIDISRCDLSDMQRNAIRQLQYTTSVKIAVKFNSAWWTNGTEMDDVTPINIVGGQSFTDLPVRAIVYPSYGIFSGNYIADYATLQGAAREVASASILAKANQPAVLMASYVRTNDAATLGGLIPSDFNGEEAEAAKNEIKDLVLKNLADVHKVTVPFLQSKYLDLHAYDFSENNRTMGAFAAFGPGKFGELYTNLTVPAARGRLHFAGEAVSIRHGWVVGAFDSAWRSICEYLLQLTDNNQDRLKKFLDEWGVSRVWAARALDTRNSHLPSEDILTKRQSYFTAAKRTVLENAANAAAAANVSNAVTALTAARAKAAHESRVTARLALLSAQEMVLLMDARAKDRLDDIEVTGEMVAAQASVRAMKARQVKQDAIKAAITAYDVAVNLAGVINAAENAELAAALGVQVAQLGGNITLLWARALGVSQETIDTGEVAAREAAEGLILGAADAFNDVNLWACRQAVPDVADDDVDLVAAKASAVIRLTAAGLMD